MTRPIKNRTSVTRYESVWTELLHSAVECLVEQASFDMRDSVDDRIRLRAVWRAQGLVDEQAPRQLK